MRIQRIHVNGFGRFADFGLGLFERPVTVFLGPNEAGKSTLLEFIRRVFFGFPDGRSRSNLYPPLAGGLHGGSLAVVSDAGETVTVQRFQGTGGGPVTLTAASGGPLPEGELSRLLGHHSRDVFQNVFTFTLDELHSEALLKDDSVNAQIYSVGMGAAKLPAALNALESEKQALFLKGGSRHKIAEAAKELREIDSKLAEVANNAAEYSRLTSQLKEVEAELERLSGLRRQRQSELDHQKQLESAWDDWNGLNQVEEQLAGLPAIDDFPVNGVSRLEKLEERIRTAQKEYDSADDEVAEAKARAEAVVEHEAILNYASDIRKLERGSTSFDDSVRDLPKRKSELEDHEKSLAATLKDLGPDWDEARLEKFDLSMTVREEILRYQERLRDARGELDRCESTLTQNATALQDSTEGEDTAQRKLDSAVAPGLDVDQILQRRNLIRAARAHLGEIDRARREASNLQGQLDSLNSAAPPAGGPGGSRVAAAISLVVGIALLVAGALLGGPVLPVGIVGGIALVGIAAYLFAFGRSTPGADAESPLAAPIRKSLHKADTEWRNHQSALKQEAAPLGLETIDEPSLIAVECALDEEQTRVHEWARLSEDLDDAKDLTKQRKRKRAQSLEAVKRARSAFGAVESEWRHWLADRSLRETFSPETVVELQGKVELGLTQLRGQRSWSQRRNAIQKAIDDYAAIAETLASEFGVAFDRNDHRTIAAAVDSLIELHTKVEKTVSKRTAAKDDLKKAERQLKERERNRREAEKEMKDLLQSGGTADAEDFRDRAEIVHRRTDLEEKRRGALERLQRLSGPGEPLAALKKQLRDTDIQAIRDEARRAKEKHDAVDKDINRSSTERGKIQSDLKRLTGEEESSRLRAERQRLLEEMRGHAREWAVGTIAENLLKEAQRKFEKERQPGVVRHAESFFKDITDGRYRRVFSPLGSSEIHVTNSSGVSKQPNQLSRGTREQLFLSLRFGLVRELSQRSKPLPVIVDEALVNFDPERGLRAARAFVELSETNQVLVFTCHPTTVELFQGAAARLGVHEPEVVPIPHLRHTP